MDTTKLTMPKVAIGLSLIPFKGDIRKYIKVLLLFKYQMNTLNYAYVNYMWYKIKSHLPYNL